MHPYSQEEIAHLNVEASNHRKEEDYWLEIFPEEFGKTIIPRDDLGVESSGFCRTEAQLDEEVYARLRALSGGNDQRAYVVLATAVLILVRKIAATSDVCIGMPALKHAEESKPLSEYLALRVWVDGQLPVKQLLNEVKARFLEALENQNYPLSLLELDRRRNGEAFSLFDIYVVFRNIHQVGYDPETFGPNVFFDFREEPDRLCFTLGYNSALYSARRAGSIARHFLQVLSIVTRDLLIAIRDLEIIAPDEKRTLFGTFNNTFTPISRDKLFLDFFQEQVAAAPGAVAAIHGGEQITYGNLNRRANQLAHCMREKGLALNEVAIVWCDRSIDFLVAVLGILKTGGAFLAINQDEPFSRAAAVIRDSGARMLLTQAAATPDWESYLRDLVSHTALNQVICLNELPDPEKLSRVLATCRLARELTREPVSHPAESFRLQYGPTQCSPERLQSGVDHLCASISREHLGTGSVGLALTNPVLQITAALSLARLGLSAQWLDADGGEDGLREWAAGNNVSLLLAESCFADEADRVFWQVPGLKHLLLLNYDKAHEASDREGYKDVFDSLARKEDLQVNDFGWFNSFNGCPFTHKEMAEHTDNCCAKLAPFINPDCKVLEIGCGHGLVYKELVGRVKYYLATDPSPAIIVRNRDYAAGQGLTNIDFQVLYANQIAAGRRDFDVVVCNNVTDYFSNTLYFEEVIVQAMSVLNDRGVIYLDDMLNLGKRDEFIRDTRCYKEKNPGARTKTNWESDLFIHTDFFRYLQATYPAITSVECSPKLSTIDNELNKYRFDVTLHIDKRKAPRTPEPFGKRRLCMTGLFGPPGEAAHAGEQKCAAHRLGAVADSRSFGSQPIENLNVPQSPDDLCYLIYSSGTTGLPKGIMLHHLGMVNHFIGMIRAMGLNADTCFAQTASCNFDIFVLQLLMPLMAGGRLVIVDKAILLEAGRLFDAIEEHEITVVELVPSVITLLLDKLKEEPRRQLPSLQHLISSGEQLTVNLAERWYKRLPGTTIINAYGPAEASDDVAIHVVDKEALPSIALVPIGKPLPNVHIYILDEDEQLCPFGVIGEIAIAGISVGKGYWNDQQKTEKAFIRNQLAGPEAGHDYGVIYKTGDLGYWHENGYVVLVGRGDFMVKIRGVRIELEEIEKVLLKFPGVSEAVVVPYINQGEKVLCAYFTRHGHLDTADLRDYLRKKLPAYMIPSYLLPLDEIPTTRNGKTDRKLLQQRIPWEKTTAAAALTNPAAGRLAAIWAEILGVKPEMIGMTSDFFDLGGHSLKAIKLVAHVHKQFNVRVPLESVFADATLGGITAAILSAGKEVFKSILVATDKPDYALSPPQRRFYVHNQLFPDDISYNTPQFYNVTGNLDPGRVEAVFRRLIERHASLRTSFRMVDNEPHQVIDQEVPFALEVIRTDGELTSGMIERFVRPFDLSVAPLLRVSLVKLGARRFVLAIDIHHIVSDEISDTILLDDFVALYLGNEPAVPALQYKDYTEWYNDCLKGGLLRKQEAYWLHVFKELPPRLNLPYDCSDEGLNHFVGDDLIVTLGGATLEKARKVMKETATTSFAFFLAVFNVLLAKLTGQEDIVVGTPVSGRDHAELDGVIGLFLNQLALRNNPAPEKSFCQFLAEVKEVYAKAVQAQMYPFDTLTGRLGLQGNLGENPLYEVMFAHLQKRPDVLVMDGIEFSTYPTRHNTAKANLQLTVFEGNAKVDLVLTYSGRFSKSTAERLFSACLEIVEQVIDNPDLAIDAIKVSHPLAEAASGFNSGRLNLDFH